MAATNRVSSPVVCEHPDCTEDSCGVAIQGAEVCIEHIERAMQKAFAPARVLEDMLAAPVEGEDE